MPPSKTGRQSWLDDSTKLPMIDEHVQKLSTFMDAIADGHIDDAELQGQEQRLVELMQEVEADLSDSQHAKVTRLLCELTAYNVMQTLHSIQSARPQTRPQW